MRHIQIKIKLSLIILCILASSFIPKNALSSGAAVEADLTKELEKSLALAVDLKTKFETQDLSESDLQKLRDQYNRLSTRHQRLKKEFETRLKILGTVAIQRHRDATGPFDQLIQQVLALMQRILENPAAADIQKLLDLLESAVGKREEKRIFGSLPYQPPGFAPAAPVTEPVIIPAYKTPATLHEPEDLKRPDAVPDAQAVATLAESLQWNPVSIYEWVKNNIATQWYYGSMKGAAKTLHQGSGNDLDQAALLIALLRAAGYPARYVQGVIEFFPDMQKALNLTGTRNASELGEFFRKAGIPCEPVLQAGDIVNFRIEHVWVEALIPWDNYRGAVLDDSGPLWVALDTGIKGNRFIENSPPDLPEAAFFSTIRDRYLEGVQEGSPLDFLKSKIADRFAGAQISHEDLLRRRTIEAEVMNILPTGLQFKTVAVTREYVEIPDNLKHKVNFTATSLDGGTLLFNETIDIGALSNAFPALQYEPETVEDQETINAFFGLDNTPPYLIRLRPVLVSGQKRIAVGRSGFAPGETFLLEIELHSPAGTRSFTNVHRAGDIGVIAIATGDLAAPQAREREDKSALHLLQEVAADYIYQWNQDEAALTALLRTTLVQPIPTVTTVGCTSNVDRLLDVPVKVTWQGIFMDADLRATETVGGYDFGTDADAGQLLFTLSGLQGSYLEGDALYRAFNVESVSTAHVLATAARAGLAVAAVDAHNIDTLLPELSLPDYIKADLAAAVDAGYHVTVPAGPVTVLDWTGYGYLKEDPVTKASGWMLSGAIAGGMTAGRPDRWDDYFVQRFMNPNTDPAQSDAAMAAVLKKFAVSDFQDATVGTSLAHPLKVMVQDSVNRPVAGAEVTFKVVAGGGRFENGKAAVTVTSDIAGIADTPFYVGDRTAENPTYLKRTHSANPNPDAGIIYSRQVGENIITAEIIPMGIALRSPFTAYGFAGPPARVTADLSDSGALLTLSGLLKAKVTDHFGNPISNETVTFTVESGFSFSNCANSGDDNGPDTQLLPDDAQCLAAGQVLYGDCAEQRSSIDAVSNKDGAFAYVMGGGLPEVENKITIRCGAAATSVLRKSIAFGNCDGKTAPATKFVLANLTTTDSDGNVVDAAVPGNTIELKAKIHYFQEEDQTVEETFECAEKFMRTCDRVVGTRKFAVSTDFVTSDITFNGNSGTHLGNGIYSFSYPVAKGVNTITVSGRGEIPVKRTRNSCGECRIEETTTLLADTTQRVVYGVAVDVPPELDIAVDDAGYAACDVKIQYTILPAQYTAVDAVVVIYEGERERAIIPVERQGSGFGTLAAGFLFNADSEYHARVRLNSNTEGRIESEKIKLNPGPLKIESITIQDLELHQAVLPGDRITFTAATLPTGRKVKWSVKPERPDIDVRMDAASGELVVDRLSETGWVRVRAEDAVNPCIYRQAYLHIGCLPCSSGKAGACADSAMYDLGSIDVKIGLGRTRSGCAAGHLVLRSDIPSPALLSPSALILSTFSPEVEERFDTQGRLRQIRTHQYLADIVVTDLSGYDIIFYNAADITGESDGLYVVGGEFEKRWNFSSSDAETHLIVTETVGENARTFEYHYDPTAGSWLLSRAGGLSIKERLTETIGEERTVTEIIRDQAGNVASQNSTTYRAFAWGEEIIRRVTDPEGAALTTLTQYHTDKEDTGSYGKIKEIIHADGSWTRYDYEENGRLSRETSAWLDAQPRSADGVRVVTYDYTPVDSEDGDPDTHKHRARTISEFIDGILAGRTYHAFILGDDGTETAITERVLRQNARYGEGDNQRSVTVTHPEGSGGPESGRVKSTRFPDGRITTHTYEFGTYTSTSPEIPGTFVAGAGPFKRTTTFDTTSAAPNGISHKSTRTVTIEGDSGRPLLTATELYTGSGFERLDWSINEYDGRGRITAVHNSDGTRSQTAWDCCAKVSETGAEGITTTYDQYDDLNRLVQVTRHSSSGDITTTYTYDAAGRQLTQTTTGGGIRVDSDTRYDAAGRMTAKTDNTRRTTLYQYPDPMTTVVIRPGDMTEKTGRYLDGRTRSITGSGGVPRYYTYGVNADGSRWTQVKTGTPDSPMWERTTSDLLGRTVLVERPGYEGIESIRQSYDAAGRLIRTQISGQADSLYLYDDSGEQVRTGLDVNGNGTLEPASMDRITDSDSRYVKMEDHWWLQSVRKIYAQENDGSATTVSTRRRQVTGLGDGLISKAVTVDIHGNRTIAWTELDPATRTRTEIIDFPDAAIDAKRNTVGGLLMSTRSKTGLTTTFGYDGLGRRISVTDPRTGTAVTHYDELGQVEWIEDAAGNRTRFAYEAATGRKISRTDAAGKVTRFAYDDQGQLLHTWGDVPYPVSYAYDTYGRRIAMTTYRTGSEFNGQIFPADAVGDTTQWRFDPAGGLLESKVYADGTEVRYTYTTGGRLHTRTWARQHNGRPLTTTYTYNPATGELTSIDYSDDTPDITFLYDRLGRERQVTDAAGTHSFTYNNQLQLESEALSGIYDATLTRTYESDGIAGRAAGFELDSDYAVTYGYDGDTGRFNSLTWNAGSQSDGVTYDYLTDSHLPDQFSTTSGRQTRYHYEAHRNLTTRVENRHNNLLVSQYGYQYDNIGRRTAATNSGYAFAQVAFSTHAYNDRSELTASRRYLGSDISDTANPVHPQTRDYRYDNIGNRTRSTAAATVTNYAPANPVNQYTAITRGTEIHYPAHDPDGNLTKALDGQRYTYNAENRLIAAQPENPMEGDTRVEFLYDYQGRRIKKAIHTYQSEQWTLTTTHLFVYDGWNLIKQITKTNGQPAVDTYFIWGLDLSRTLTGAGGTGGLLAAIKGASTYHYLFDANGNVAQMIDAADGAIAAHYEYDPFGNEVLAAGKLAGENPHRFSTKFFDGETGLYYYGYRYYSPELGRWVSRDPLNEDGGINLYTFILNNPANYVDPFGLEGLNTLIYKLRASLEREADNLWERAEKYKNRSKSVVIGSYADYIRWTVNASEAFAREILILFIPENDCDMFLALVTADMAPAINKGASYLSLSTKKQYYKLVKPNSGFVKVGTKETFDSIVDNVLNKVDNIPDDFAPKSGLGNGATSPWLNDLRTGVRSHLEMFREGGSYLVPESAYNRFVKGQKVIGRYDGQFITTKSAMDKLISETGGDIAAINKGLGTSWSEPLYRIDIDKPLLHNARLPSGIETGADPRFFRWGGYTSGGKPEIIINQIPSGAFSASPL